METFNRRERRVLGEWIQIYNVSLFLCALSALCGGFFLIPVRPVCGGKKMRRFLLFVVAALVLFPSGHSFGFSSKGRDCEKCHTLKKAEAEALLQSGIPNVKVLAVRDAPTKTMWEIDVEADGKKGLVYLEFSKKYLFSGSIFDLKEKKNITQDRFSEINRVDVRKIPLKDALVLGDRNARKRVIVFDDPG
jgi:thiol:disulfide interchange protein DsbC